MNFINRKAVLKLVTIKVERARRHISPYFIGVETERKVTDQAQQATSYIDRTGQEFNPYRTSKKSRRTDRVFCELKRLWEGGLE